MKPRCLSSVALLLVCPSALLAAADVQFAQLARHVPDSANAIVLVNVQKLFATPVAQKERWREDAEKRIADGMTSIPVDADQLLLGAQLDLRSMQPVWQVALVRMDSAPALETLARQHGGVTDTVANMPGLRLPDDSYVVQFSAQTLGAYAPGDRQAVSRWTRGSSVPLSAPLQEAVGYADAGAEIIMALDLSDVAAVEDVHHGIQDLDEPQLKDSDLDIDELAQVFGHVKSLTLGMTFDQRPFGKIKLEFDRDVSVPSKMIKPLLLAILASRGLMIDEFEDWKVEVQGRRIMVGGYLTSSGLTRLSSLIDLPTGAFHSLRQVEHPAKTGASASAAVQASVPGKQPPSAEPPLAQSPLSQDGSQAQAALNKGSSQAQGPPKQETKQPPVSPRPEISPPQGLPNLAANPAHTPPSPPVGPAQMPQAAAMSMNYVLANPQATRQYFHSTRQLLLDLRGRKREARSIPQIGGWYEMYARRVDRLPLLDVDDQMLAYGGYVANQLRGASVAIKSARIRNRVGEVTAANQGVSFTYRGTTITRGFTPREHAAVNSLVRAETTAEAATAVQQIEAQLDAATSEIRLVMTKKYQTEF